LTAREFDLLLVLARHAGQVLSRVQLLERVWGYTWEVDTNVVDVFVGYLRRKLEADGASRLLHTTIARMTPSVARVLVTVLRRQAAAGSDRPHLSNGSGHRMRMTGS
jgi:hypothetical protein